MHIAGLLLGIILYRECFFSNILYAVNIYFIITFC